MIQKNLLQDTGILLEGGAMRSIFSAGILDVLSEQDIHIPNVLAVSAGAYAGMNYVSGQAGRIVESNILMMKKRKYVGLGTFVRTGALFDMDLLFDKIPRELVPFDFQAFFASATRFLTSTVNLNTGEAVYYDDFRDEDHFLKVCRAANSLPLISRIVELDGAPMLDGGMADAIPIEKALLEGWRKIVVVLTRDEEYRKKPGGLYSRVVRCVYRKYPAFLKTVENRWRRYNESLEKVQQLVREGRAYVFRPQTMNVSNNESDVPKLLKYYEYSKETAREKLAELKGFLGI